MLKIGDLARLAHVSVKTLRLYDQRGLLKPAWIDRFTGYRYYHDGQMQQLNRILRLKETGLTLQQIAHLLEKDASLADLRAVLARKLHDTELELAAQQRRLHLIAGYLEGLTDADGAEPLDALLPPGQDLVQQAKTTIKESNMRTDIVTMPAFQMVGLCYHGANKNNEIPGLWARFLLRLGEVQRINPSVSYGVCSIPVGLPEGHFEYVVGVQVAEGAPIPEGMVLRSLPELRCAVFAHRGALDTLGQTYRDAYESGLPQAGLEPLAPGFDMEVYTAEWDDGSPNSVLYIHIPVK